MKYLLDAPLILNIFINKQVKAEFYDLVDDDLLKQVYISKLTKLECLNVLRKQRFEKVRADIIHFIEVIPNLDSEDINLSTLMEFGIKINHSIYDSYLYLLAQRDELIFLTCDSKFYEKVESLGNIELIR